MQINIGNSLSAKDSIGTALSTIVPGRPYGYVVDSSFDSSEPRMVKL